MRREPEQDPARRKEKNMGRDRKEEEDLQNPDNWDFEQAEEQLPVRRARAVVSVAFSRDDFERIADFAESNDMKISEMIRNAALDRVSDRVRTVYLGATLAITDAGWGIVPDPTLEIASGTAVPA